MSLRVTQLRATSAYWLVAGAGLAGMIALSVAVFLTPPQKPEVASTSSVVASVVKASQVRAAPAAFELETIAPEQSAASASQKSKATEPQAIASPDAAPMTYAGTLPVTQPETSAPVMVAAKPDAQIAIVTPKLAQLPNAPPPKTSPRPHSSNRVDVPAPTIVQRAPIQQALIQQAPVQQAPVQQSPVRQAETIVVKGYQQMALNVDGIGRGNSLTIQLPLAKRK